MLKTAWKSALILVCVAALACNSGKAPAEAAMKLAEEAVNGVSAEAQKLVPDDFKSLSDDLAAAKDQLTKGDYKAALASAQAVQQKAKDVMAGAQAKKDELTKTWNGLAATVPGMVDAIKGRVDALSAMKKLPKGMDAGKLAAAKEGLAVAQSSWGEAQEAFKAGKWSDAIAKATAVKDKAASVMGTLGMSSAEAAAPAAAPAK
ncbi:MAG TPA: hypothetical protein VKG23_07485 [Thermoanaerobaculia bacterium]|nr:hypothetical protein [Thermoanaerobaculia bacterium]